MEKSFELYKKYLIEHPRSELCNKKDEEYIRNINEDSEEFDYFIQFEEAITILLNKNVKKITYRKIDDLTIDLELNEVDFSGIVDNFEKYRKSVITRTTNYFKNNEISYTRRNKKYQKKPQKNLYMKLNLNNIEGFINKFINNNFKTYFFSGCNYCKVYFLDYYRNKVEKLPLKYINHYDCFYLCSTYKNKVFSKFLNNTRLVEKLLHSIRNEFTIKHIFELIKENPHYSDISGEMYEKAISYINKNKINNNKEN